MIKNLPAMQVTRVRSLGWEDPLGKGMATYSLLAWRIPWTQKDLVIPKSNLTEQLNKSLNTETAVQHPRIECRVMRDQSSLACPTLRDQKDHSPQALLSRQEYQRRLPRPPPGDLPDPGIEPASHDSCTGSWALYRERRLGSALLQRRSQLRLHVGTVSLTCFRYYNHTEWPAPAIPAPLPAC